MKRRVRRDSWERPAGALATHFTREGRPKSPYRTEAEAKSAAQLAWTLNGVELNAYQCDHCHRWHIGKRFREE